jgi:hypothetical protein
MEDMKGKDAGCSAMVKPTEMSVTRRTTNLMLPYHGQAGLHIVSYETQSSKNTLLSKYRLGWHNGNEMNFRLYEDNYSSRPLLFSLP